MQNKSARTKQLIIERSAQLFNTKGFAGTSMGDILDATGLQKGGVYGHFSSKEAIALAAFEYAHETIKTALGEKIREQRNAVDRLLAILEFYKNYSIQPTIAGGCPILNSSVDADDTFPALKMSARKALEAMLETLEIIIRKGQERGEIQTGIDPRLSALQIFSQVEGGLMMSKVADNPSLLNSILDGLKNWVKTDLKQPF